jgi:hypothetical protein
MNVFVFSGPTLPREDVLQAIDAVCLPPIAQGDMYRAALRRPDAIGIIDGYFESVPAVWHKEILWAMAQGIHVFGSASMGALRAAELEPYGMVGVGAIFEAFRDGTLEDDDEVAIGHGPTEESYQFSSLPMVNVRATLARAQSEGVATPEFRNAFLRAAKGIFYAHRSWPRLLDLAPGERVPAAEVDRFRRWLPAGAVNQKREDALAMLHAIRAFLGTNPGPKKVSFAFEETLHWAEFVRCCGEVPPPEADHAVLEELRRDQCALERAETAALGWSLASAAARREGVQVEAADVLAQSREFCSRNGIAGSDEVATWLERNHATRADLERCLRSAALAFRARELSGAALRQYLLEYLRWSGEYERLLARIPPPG